MTLEASKEGSKEGAKEGSMEGADDAGGSNGERGLGTDGDGVAVPTAAEEGAERRREGDKERWGAPPGGCRGRRQVCGGGEPEAAHAPNALGL